LESKLSADLEELFRDGDVVVMAMENAQAFLSKKEIGKALQNINRTNIFLSDMQNFLDLYGNFIVSLDQKFGTNINESCILVRKLGTEVRNDLKNISINISTGRISFAVDIIADSLKKGPLLEEHIAKIYAIQHVIDFSKLAHKDWKEVGKAGVHYRSKVFLSYAYRDKDQTKDENQKFIDYLIKPLLNLLDIEPVTARSHLHVQDNIEEDTIALVSECDGIIGFYTLNDATENVEHEVSNNVNIVAICREEGANCPSMRRTKLQFDFSGKEPSQLLLQIVNALKEKELFKLKI
jgi:hypothetical protein